MGQKLFNGHFGWLVLWFAMRERQISMLYHVLKGNSWVIAFVVTHQNFNFTFICRFIVMQNSVIKYITRIGQKTGTLKTSKKVQTIAMVVDFVMAYQNLNSGNRLINGLNSSLLLVGNAGPSGSSAKMTTLRYKPLKSLSAHTQLTRI